MISKSLLGPLDQEPTPTLTGNRFLYRHDLNLGCVPMVFPESEESNRHVVEARKLRLHRPRAFDLVHE